MALDTLLARFECRTVTPVTADETSDVTAKPAWIGACTPVTPVTAENPSTANDPEPPNSQQISLTAQRLAKELIAAAMKRCDQFSDNDEARNQMRRDCMALPPHLQADLLQLFQGKPVHFN